MMAIKDSDLRPGAFFAKREDAEYVVAAKAAEALLPLHISALLRTLAAKQPAVAPMILEDFFLTEEKRSIRTRIFQDLLGNAVSAVKYSCLRSSAERQSPGTSVPLES
jgi:hypothetical protein